MNSFSLWSSQLWWFFIFHVWNKVLSQCFAISSSLSLITGFRLKPKGEWVIGVKVTELCTVVMFKWTAEAEDLSVCVAVQSSSSFPNFTDQRSLRWTQKGESKLHFSCSIFTSDLKCFLSFYLFRKMFFTRIIFLRNSFSSVYETEKRIALAGVKDVRED